MEAHILVAFQNFFMLSLLHVFWCGKSVEQALLP